MKKIILKILSGLFILLVFLAVLAWATGNSYLIKGIACTYLRGYTTAHIYDLDYFDSREVNSGKTEPWKEHSSLGKITLTESEKEIHKKYKSAGFLVVKNDEILMEEYWKPHDREAISNSFSMVKSVTGLLVGIAHDEGLIKNLDDKACDYIPKLCAEGDVNSGITIRHLLTMTSTLNFDENYGDPFGFMARVTYGSDLEAETYDGFEAQKEPGSEWQYLGGNTLLLGFIVEEVTGKTLSDYLSEKVWFKIGAESPAKWALDHEGGKEKSYCCFNARVRDYARLGKLILQKGSWNGQQIVSTQFVEEMTTPLRVPSHKGDGPADHYGYQIWLDQIDGEKVVNFRGMLGQYISIIPEQNLIMVRVGHKRGERDDHCPSDLAEWIKMAKRISSEV